VVSLSLEQAGGPWQGHYTFYTVLLEAKRYFPIFWSQVIATRLRLGAGDGFGQSGDLPMFRRFFAGGINSTRGYERHRVGPLTSGDKPIGGRSLFEGNLELRSPLYGGLGGVLFFDAAIVDPDPFRYSVDDLQYGVGPGIRYQTPIGPIRLDIGFPLEAPASLPSWQIHFSIGQAF
jgi:outer membrane protein insertion porin family/translocation and assembly module TamA